MEGRAKKGLERSTLERGSSKSVMLLGADAPDQRKCSHCRQRKASDKDLTVKQNS